MYRNVCRQKHAPTHRGRRSNPEFPRMSADSLVRFNRIRYEHQHGIGRLDTRSRNSQRMNQTSVLPGWILPFT